MHSSSNRVPPLDRSPSSDDAEGDAGARGLSSRLSQVQLATFRNVIAVLPAEPWRRSRVLLELANTLSESTDPDRRTCQDAALVAAEEALKLVTPQQEPRVWAEGMALIAGLLQDRPSADRDKNSQRVIACLETSARLYQQLQVKDAWAEVQCRLAEAWRRRSGGVRRQHLLKASAAYESALTVYRRERQPALWAEVQNELGISLCECPGPDASSRAARAVQCFEQALLVRTREVEPILWAMTSVNLVNALRRLPSDPGLETRALSLIESCEALLTAEHHPLAWSMLQLSRANFLAAHVGEHGEGLEKARTLYESVLPVLAGLNAVALRATVQHNLGIVLSALARLDSPVNDGLLGQALEYLEQARTVRTHARAPLEWARTRLAEGTAQMHLTSGDRLSQMQSAAQAHAEALTILKVEEAV